MNLSLPDFCLTCAGTEGIAQECFKKFSGIWEVMVLPGNEGAYRFWRGTIKNYTNNNFAEYTRIIAHFDNKRRNLFKFDSKVV